MAEGENKGGKTTALRAVIRDGEGRKRVEKIEVKVKNPDTLKYLERKLVDKGVQRMDRHPADGLTLKHLPKSGHGGKYTWEGPGDPAENELEAPPAIDERDPNFIGEEEEEEKEGEVEEEVKKVVVGEIEVAKVAEEREGVARVEVHPPLQL